MTAPKTLLKVEGVTKDFPKVATGGQRLRTLLALAFRSGNLPHFRALDGINLEVRQGESLGLVGENGAGKSTLLKIIAGVIRPTRGSVTRNGTIGALLELGSGFHPDYTGRENIFLSGALMGFSRSEMLERVDAIAEFADIGAFLDEPIRHYSSGMVVRLGFAVATSLRPEILITDEVLAVGDESFQKKCVQWIERYLENGGTLLLCSHSMFHVQTLCSHAVWIHQGRQRLYGEAFEVTREYLTYHEEKRRREGVAYRPAPMGAIPRIESAWIESGGGEKVARIASGEDLVVQGVAYEPDDRPPVVLVGIIRADGTPVYGSHSNETGYRPHRIAPTRFAFALRFAAPGLLPGKYTVRAHALDPEGLRLCDTVEMEVVVSGATRDYGLVRLEHEWQPGRGEE